MSKPDRFKEEIGWLKALGGLLIAGLISMLAWLVQNYGSVTRSGLLFVVTCSFLLTVLTIAIIARLYRCFKILEAL